MGQKELRIGWRSSAVDISCSNRQKDGKSADPLSRKRFCLVAGRAYARSTVRQIFQSHGVWSVTEARSYKGAIRWLEERSHDAIVLDAEVEDKAAVQFIRTIRGHECDTLSQLPVIALTNAVEMDDIAVFRDAGINAIVLKPFSAEGLMHRVRKVFERPAGLGNAGTQSISGHPDQPVERVAVNPGVKA